MIKWFFRLKKQEMIEFYGEHKTIVQYLTCFSTMYLILALIAREEYIKGGAGDKVGIIALITILSAILAIVAYFIIVPIIKFIANNIRKAILLRSIEKDNNHVCDTCHKLVEVKIELVASNYYRVKCPKCGGYVNGGYL
jgi:predicted RNA-binding Zn-ribbon protein involved in translation (DUF1610 family)